MASCFDQSGRCSVGTCIPVDFVIQCLLLLFPRENVTRDYLHFNHTRFREYVKGLNLTCSYREMEALTDHRISAVTFCKWVQGLRPSIELFFVFCQAFDIPPDLFSFDPNDRLKQESSSLSRRVDNDLE